MKSLEPIDRTLDVAYNNLMLIDIPELKHRFNRLIHSRKKFEAVGQMYVTPTEYDRMVVESKKQLDILEHTIKLCEVLQEVEPDEK